MYNERDSLDQLVERLLDFRCSGGANRELEFLFVDDGSSDGTAEALREILPDYCNYRIISHAKNKGIAAAINTGLDQALGDCVVSIDSDGSYDLELLCEMLTLLTPETDVIVASPYHPQGRVENVSAWRITLSKCASKMYRLVMRSKLHCYTSCFRVYRRNRCRGVVTYNSGFVGIAEFLWKAESAGLAIIEYPATLRPRKSGKSKMKLYRTIGGHLLLIMKIGICRLLHFYARP